MGYNKLVITHEHEGNVGSRGVWYIYLHVPLKN